MAKVRLDQKPTLETLNNVDFFPVIDSEDVLPGGIPKLKKASLESLKNFIGGGGVSAQPDRVIIINTTLTEDIEGKAYSTFAAAQAYMETYPEQKFCVELPAGNFGTTADDHITLSDQWVIHGNNTRIVAPINSNVVLGQDLTMNPNGVYITGCTISGGFVGHYYVNEEEIVNLPVYKLSNCRLTEFCSDSVKENECIVYCEYCEIETTRSHNDLVAKGVSMSVPRYIFITHSTILQLGASAVSDIYCVASCVSNVGANSGIFIGCAQTGKTMEETCGFNVSELELLNCTFTNMKNYNNDMTGLKVSNSHIYLIMEGEINILYDFMANNSNIDLRSNNGAIITIDRSWISPDTNCKVHSNITLSATTDNTMHYIMYSTDGGLTMSYDSAGATHYGVLKALPEEYSYDTSSYMWFPMPA